MAAGPATPAVPPRPTVPAPIFPYTFVAAAEIILLIFFNMF